ncbi:MAG: fluoride efflux transporter CrcB [bacterium]|nr:fluoride efflux transporter CrcB [bacterium]
MRTVIIIGIGGFLGANTRYWISGWALAHFTRFLNWPLPYGTIFVNLTGSFGLALFVAYALKRTPFSNDVRLLVATGFFGAYTTFSTYALESLILMREGSVPAALANILLTNGLCLLGAALGLWFGTLL